MRAKLNFFLELLRRELTIFRRGYIGEATDTVIMFFNFIVVFGYFIPMGGQGVNWGPFMMVGSIATFGLVSAVNNRVAQVISDVHGDRTISYFLTMPVPSSWVFISMALCWSTVLAILTLILFPVGKLVLFSQFSLASVSWGKLFLIYITLNIFIGFFSLWLAGAFQKINNIGRLWCRVVNPLFMFGAFFYSFKDALTFNPLIAKLTLINPVVYVTEGMRAAMLGQEGSLNFWLCLTVLWGYILLCGWHGIARLKKWLDVV